jgi:uncharacterized membrane protein YkvA (DUF1232 family)
VLAAKQVACLVQIHASILARLGTMDARIGRSGVMARLGRKAALTALWTAVRASRRGPSLGRRLAAIPRMLGAIVIGRYDGKARLAAMTLAGAYIVSPIDVIPDWFVTLFGVGLVDDAAVAVWLAGAVLSETERFLAWEAQRAGAVPGRVKTR